MLINCYYYAPHNHTLLSEHIDADLARMAELGTDAVSLCVQESQINNWHQQRLKNVVRQIHDHGMQAHAVPNRWAGLVAGWLDGFGRFTLENADTLVQDVAGQPTARGEMVSCINNPRVVAHVRDSLTALFEHLDFDGLIWDEPHARACHCAYCRALNPAPDAAWSHRRFAAFIDEMSRYAKSRREGLTVSLFVQPHQDGLLEALLDTHHIDYLGSDGHIRSTDHQMHRMKGTIFEAYDKFTPQLCAAGKATFFLLEAQRHRDEDLDNYLAHVDAAFALPIDHLMYYYSAHEMSLENEARFNAATWAAVKQAHVRRRQPNPNGEHTDIILETERLILCYQRPSDVASLIDLWTDPQVTHYMGGPRERARLQAAFDETAQSPNAEQYDLWPVIEKATGQVIGHCGLLDKEVGGKTEIELIYVLAASAWGRGYATEIGQALKRYAFEALELTRLIALIEPENAASARVAEKIGMQFEHEVVRPGGDVRNVYAVGSDRKPA